MTLKNKRSAAISAEPLGELINIELIWAGQPPTIPSAAAVAAGFPQTPEVVEVIDTTCAADRHRATLESRTDAGRFSQSLSQRAAAEYASRTPR